MCCGLQYHLLRHWVRRGSPQGSLNFLGETVQHLNYFIIVIASVQTWKKIINKLTCSGLLHHSHRLMVCPLFWARAGCRARAREMLFGLCHHWLCMGRSLPIAQLVGLGEEQRWLTKVRIATHICGCQGGSVLSVQMDSPLATASSHFVVCNPGSVTISFFPSP